MKFLQPTETELWAYISRTADDVTLQKVEKWMNSPDFNEALFIKTTAIYEHTFEPKLAIEKAKEHFFENISTIEKPRVYPFKNLLKYAAILVLIISGTFAYQHIAFNMNQLIMKTTFGQQKEVELADGSTVWLNASSSLSYQKKSPRTLYLEGEAFFEVAKDTAHPFTVSTSDGLKVRALGTSFNVKSYVNSSTTETKLITGKVEVTSDKQFKNKILLIPNEKITFYRDKKEMVKSKMEGNENSIAWKDGKIQFKNTIFREIALDLKTQFNIKFKFENEQIANSKFTGQFNNTTPVREILEILSLSKDFNYELNTATNEWLIK